MKDNRTFCQRLVSFTLQRIAPLIKSDELFLKWKFWARLGYKLNLKDPKSFNEKLQWIKLYDRKPEYTTMVDKIEAKKYVASIIGEEYIIPTLSIYNSADEIDFSILPNKFVIKCSHDSGGILICKDKSKLDIEEAKDKLRKGLKRTYFKYNREWPYKNVVPRLIVEQYMEDESGDLRDYKFFCFNGEPAFLYLSEGLKDHKTAKISFVNCDWEIEPFKRNDYSSFDKLPPKPENFDVMLDIARKLSKNIPHLRVDLYNIHGKIFFGELTFFTCSGMVPFEPVEWDYKLGALINLPQRKHG